MFPNPSITPPSLSDYQFQFGGLTFGAGTPWGVLKVEGLGMADIRTADTPWPRDHGASRGLDVFGERTIIFDLWDVAGGTSLQARQLELAAATNVSPTAEGLLWFQLPNNPIMCVPCRPIARPTTIDSDYAAANVAKPELHFLATDPRIYGAGQEASVALGDTPETGATVSPVNEGNTEARFVVIFSDEVENPALQNLSIAGTPTVRFVKPGEPEEPTVEDGDQLSVNTGTPHLVQLYSGTVAEGNWVNGMKLLTWDSIWFDLPPGGNDLRYHADGGSAGSTATIQWASAWQL